MEVRRQRNRDSLTEDDDYDLPLGILGSSSDMTCTDFSCVVRLPLLFGAYKGYRLTSTGTNKMRKTNALYLKTQRLIAETHRDTEGYTKTHTETHTETLTETHSDTERHTQFQLNSFKSNYLKSNN